MAREAWRGVAGRAECLSVCVGFDALPVQEALLINTVVPPRFRSADLRFIRVHIAPRGSSFSYEFAARLVDSSARVETHFRLPPFWIADDRAVIYTEARRGARQPTGAPADGRVGNPMHACCAGLPNH